MYKGIDLKGKTSARADIRMVSILQRVRYALWRRGWFQVVRTSGQLHAVRVGRLVFYLRPLWWGTDFASGPSAESRPRTKGASTRAEPETQREP